jgi:transcriptional antiterminator RfaH
MPLLPLEPFLFPEDLLSGPAHGGAGDDCWWVLHTRPRAEKALARQMLARSLGFFLPLYQKRWRSGGRLLSSHLPLFPGYVFLRGNPEARVRALETNLVARVLPVADQLSLYNDLARVHRLIQTDAELAPEERLQPGTPVEIIGGPLAGLTGKVLRRGKQLRFFVEVELLQRGVSVEVESWMIQPLAGAAAGGAGCVRT